MFLPRDGVLHSERGAGTPISGQGIPQSTPSGWMGVPPSQAG